MRHHLVLLPLLLAAPLAAQATQPEFVVRSAGGEPLGAAALAERLAAYDVVFLGEEHDDLVAHAVQAELVAELGRGRPLLLSLEMFERDVQVHLDEYAAGRMDEAAFLAASRPWRNYATGYRAMVELARERRWPVVAANVPRPLAAAVSRGGPDALDTLPQDAWRLFAAHRACAPAGEYFERFAATMGSMESHGGHVALVRYYASQCLKDETMAESIVRARQAWPGLPVVHVNGAFHSDFRLGTVERLLRREPGLRVAVVSMLPVDEPEAADVAAHAGRAEWFVFTRRPARVAEPAADATPPEPGP
jgi:uncharacterized iron-regulated protein